jgi:site-specific DNA recombinase
MKRVIELIRVSTEGQAAEGRAGIPAQRAANRRTAAQYGLDIIKTIDLADVSGAAVLHTPEMQELLRLMESPEIHGVVAKEFSRLMRPENFLDYDLLQAFADTKTVLYLPEGPIDLSSKSGRLLGTIRAAIAGLERSEILERVWAAKEEKRRAGEHPQNSNSLPFGVGYEVQQGRWYYKPEVEKVQEAIRMFLSGDTSYWSVGRKVGIEPYNLRIILRNPIYTGWRVYTLRRDPSPRAFRVKSDGRQGDRPKIPRAPEDVIRVKVLEPLVSDEDFQRLQRILDLKKQYHWRSRPDYKHRFAYHGFLRCGECGNLVYTHVRHPHDWYVCKSRTTAERKVRQQRGFSQCTNPYMRRERLEGHIDQLFSSRLTDREFLEAVTSEYENRSKGSDRHAQELRIRQEIENLEKKRQRVLEAYFDNLIHREERDRRLGEIEKDLSVYRDLLLRTEPNVSELSSEQLADALGPFHEWEFLSMEDRRGLLEAVIPEIHVQDYKVVGLSLLTDSINRNEMTRTGRGSSPRPA